LNRFQSSPSLFLSFSLLWRLRNFLKNKKIKVVAAAAIATEQPNTACYRDANCSVHHVASQRRNDAALQATQRAATSLRCKLQRCNLQPAATP